MVRKHKTLIFAGFCVLMVLMAGSAGAQDKDACAGIGWEPYFIDQISDLTGTYTATNNRDCAESAKWQYTATITIWKENGQYMARVYGGEKATAFRVSGSQVRFNRDVTGSAGADKKQRPDQLWTGGLQRNRRSGSIRFYGTWTGAYDYVTDNTPFNHDFMIVIK